MLPLSCVLYKGSFNSHLRVLRRVSSLHALVFAQKMFVVFWEFMVTVVTATSCCIKFLTLQCRLFLLEVLGGATHCVHRFTAFLNV